MQQHAETVDGGVSAQTRTAAKGRFERHIDDVDDNGALPATCQIDVELRFVDHAERGRVNEKPGIALHRRALVPWVDRDARSRYRQIAGQMLGPCLRSVYESDLLDLSLGQCRDNRPRRAAGAENDRRPCRRFPIRGTLAQILAKPENIGIASFEAAIGRDNHRVHRPDAACQRVGAIDDR
jgi:hypothetical protein